MAEDSFEILIKRRGIAKRSLTNIEHFLCREDLKPHELLVRQDRLSAIWQEFKLSQDLIEINAEIPDQHFLEREEFENRFYAVSSKIGALLSEPTRSLSPESERSEDSNSSRLKLPTIKLPCFGGNYVEFFNFKNTFESLIINNTGIDDVQRLHYLIASLDGEAKGLIGNIAITSGNFHVAWKLLVDRYNNPKIISAQHVKALLSLSNATSGTCQDYRGLVNEVSSNLKAQEGLGIEVPIHELLLIEVILSKMKLADSHDWEIKNAGARFHRLKELLEFLEAKMPSIGNN